MKAQNSIRFLATAIFLAAFSVAVQAGEKMQVVYHVADADKVNFALNNMRNHIKGVGGPENVELVLVVHGPGLKRFHDIQATDKLRKMVSGLQDQGVEFDACGNTMRAQQVQTDDLIPGMIRVDQGGVVRIAELQQQGYLYIRP
jgi:intracellular sulfur oxidation DsrE/DsrF family protein